MEKKHDLKIEERFFGPILTGKKNFEVRKNDRDYKEGDFLILRSFDPVNKKYTGGQAVRKVTYILKGENWGIKKGYVVLGIQ